MIRQTESEALVAQFIGGFLHELLLRYGNATSCLNVNPKRPCTHVTTASNYEVLMGARREIGILMGTDMAPL